MKKNTSPLSLSKETLKNLGTRTGLRTGGLVESGAGCPSIPCPTVFCIVVPVTQDCPHMTFACAQKN